MQPWLLIASLVATLSFYGHDTSARAQANKAFIEPTKPSSGEWPNWRGPNQDGISTEGKLIDSWPETGPKTLWECELGGGFSSVVVSRGRIVTLSKQDTQETIECYDAWNGNPLWEVKYAGNYDKHPGLDERFRHSGPRSTPTIDGNRLYVIATTGILRCLDVRNGDVLWQQDILELAAHPLQSFGYCASPLIVGDLLLIQPGGTKGNSIAAFEKTNGNIVWLKHDFPIGYATPLAIEHAGETQIVFFTGTAVVGLSPQNGKLFWQFPWQTNQFQNIAAPIYFDGKLYISSATIHNPDGGVLLRLQENANPEVIWKSKLMANWYASSILYKGHLFGFSGMRLRTVEFESGTRKWDQTGLGQGSLIIADDHLIVLSQHGELVLAEARTDQYKELARWNAFEPPQEPALLTAKYRGVFSVPVLAGGILYLRDQWRLLAVDLRDRS